MNFAKKKVLLFQSEALRVQLRPLNNQILMEVIALAFFDPRSSRGPQRLLESAI